MSSSIGSFTALLKERIAGLDIGEDYISAASISIGENGLPEVSELGCVEKENGLTNDAIASLIRKLWRKSNFDTRTVSSCFRGPALNVRYFKYPKLSNSELRSALSLEAENAFQRPKKELYIDWQVFGEAEGVLAAAPKEDVRSYLKLLKIAGLYPVAIDIGCMAIASLFTKLKKPQAEETVAVVNAGVNNADISILEGGHICPRYVYSGSVSMREKPSYLVENIDELLRYYQFKLRRKPVERIVFTGCLSREEDFKRELEKAISVPVEFWNPLNDMVVNSNISSEEKEAIGPLAATSIGLAMNGI